jgi:hypothetical protein
VALAVFLGLETHLLVQAPVETLQHHDEPLVSIG